VNAPTPTPGQAAFTWDYRQPAPMDENAAAVRELSGGAVRMSMPETGGDEYQLVVSRSEPQPAPDLEAAFASGARVRTGPCTVDAHDREHFQVRTNGHWLCGHLLASLLIAQGIVAAPEPQPAPELAADLREAQHASRTHRERLQELLADTPFEFRPDWAAEYEDEVGDVSVPEPPS
jgi:hypothetical protein